jgi:hypothetical protein
MFWFGARSIRNYFVRILHIYIYIPVLYVLFAAHLKFSLFFSPAFCRQYHHISFGWQSDLGVRMQGGDPTLIAEMVKKGWLGRKSGKGFYMYPKDAKKGAEKQLNPEMLAMLKEIRQLKGTAGSTPPSVEDVQNRIMARFVNECVFCLQDGVIRAPADGTYTFF